jgi:hypothetical protein
LGAAKQTDPTGALQVWDFGDYAHYKIVFSAAGQMNHSQIINHSRMTGWTSAKCTFAISTAIVLVLMSGRMQNFVRVTLTSVWLTCFE